jgi:hypothetical protein
MPPFSDIGLIAGIFLIVLTARRTRESYRAPFSIRYQDPEITKYRNSPTHGVL